MTDRLPQIKKALAGPYGIQGLNSHDATWMVEEIERLRKAAESNQVKPKQVAS